MSKDAASPRRMTDQDRHPDGKLLQLHQRANNTGCVAELFAAKTGQPPFPAGKLRVMPRSDVRNTAKSPTNL
ncbi:hypothetical protein [Jannaschia sp. 2305UL9-9]|uniref:hypothetical protein n=1 Tax=Jannaschia sp. 2305UL9-9 TaxID=3121638 RepID=UPI00352900D4